MTERSDGTCGCARRVWGRPRRGRIYITAGDRAQRWNLRMRPSCVGQASPKGANTKKNANRQHLFAPVGDEGSSVVMFRSRCSLHPRLSISSRRMSKNEYAVSVPSVPAAAKPLPCLRNTRPPACIIECVRAQNGRLYVNKC